MARHSGRQRPYERDEPYILRPRPRGVAPAPPSALQKGQGWWVGGEWIPQPSQRPPTHQQRSRLSPITVEDDADSDCYEVPPPVPWEAKNKWMALADGPATAQFDFNNSSQALPWTLEPTYRYQARSFADTADTELLAYIADRSVSRGFLVDIDQCLREHPEIADYPEGRDTIFQLNSLSPLEAYKYFLRGYTRPARYINGIVKTEDFTLPVNFPYEPLRTKHDPELVDFFIGFEYRHDIIDRIDHVVRQCVLDLSLGRPVLSGYRWLVCYAIWGNPSDAYKWYEYSLQEDYLPHRYLPEHVVLGHIPKPAGEAPQPLFGDSSRRHMNVRYHMARANDEGIDVLDVLMTEFRTALVRKGFRRIEIEALYEQGKNRLENERHSPTGVDVVDLIMDEVSTQQRRNVQPLPNSRSTRIRKPRPNRKNKANTAKGLNVPPALRAQAAELRAVRTSLLRSYDQEQEARNVAARCTGVITNMRKIDATRARAERRYVNCIIRYLRDAHRMSSLEAAQMQRRFTRKKMAGAGLTNRDYLLSLYPRELY